MVQSYTYGPFGETTGSGSEVQPFQYAGRERDESGLYYNRARYYRPEWGRFISEDPLGLAGGDNQYVYAGNNPVSGSDPTGQVRQRDIDKVKKEAVDNGWTVGKGGKHGETLEKDGEKIPLPNPHGRPDKDRTLLEKIRKRVNQAVIAIQEWLSGAPQSEVAYDPENPATYGHGPMIVPGLGWVRPLSPVTGRLPGPVAVRFAPVFP